MFPVRELPCPCFSREGVRSSWSCCSSLVAKRVALLAFWDYLKRVCFVCNCTDLLGEGWGGSGSDFLYLSCFWSNRKDFFHLFFGVL